MNGNLLDTNTIIKLLSGDKNTVTLFDSLDEIFIPVITAGELYYGAYKSTRVEENMKIFKEFLSEYLILSIDEEVSLFYADVKNQLLKTGINIPENDLWIAAIAIKNELKLVTFDKHFKYIKGLSVIGI